MVVLIFYLKKNGTFITWRIEILQKKISVLIKKENKNNNNKNIKNKQKIEYNNLKKKNIKHLKHQVVEVVEIVEVVVNLKKINNNQK